MTIMMMLNNQAIKLDEQICNLQCCQPFLLAFMTQQNNDDNKTIVEEQTKKETPNKTMLTVKLLFKNKHKTEALNKTGKTQLNHF